jgi:hypothetical protein
MKKTLCLLAMIALVVLFASACAPAAAPATQAAPPPVEVVPTQVPPVDVAPTTAPAQTFAPACQAVATCAAPDVKDTVASDRACVKKIPYEYIFIDDGVTFEVLEPDKLTCVDNGTRSSDGKRAIECHGTPAWASQVKFTNTACGGTSLTTGTGQCQEGLGYDAAQNCCAPLSTGDTGSVIITVNMGACPSN